MKDAQYPFLPNTTSDNTFIMSKRKHRSRLSNHSATTTDTNSI